MQRKRVFKRVKIGLGLGAIAAIFYAFVGFLAVIGSNGYSYKWANFKTKLTSEQFCDFCPRMAKIETKDDSADTSKTYMSVFPITEGEWLKCEESGECDVLDTTRLKSARTSQEKRDRTDRRPVVEIPDHNLRQYINAVSGASEMTCSLPSVRQLKELGSDFSYVHFCNRSDQNQHICGNNFSESFGPYGFEAKVGTFPVIASGKFYDLFNTGWQMVEDRKNSGEGPITLWNGYVWWSDFDGSRISHLKGEWSTSIKRRGAAFRLFCSAN